MYTLVQSTTLPQPKSGSNPRVHEQNVAPTMEYYPVKGGNSTHAYMISEFMTRMLRETSCGHKRTHTARSCDMEVLRAVDPDRSEANVAPQGG